MSDKVEVLHEGRFLSLQRFGRWEYVSRTVATGAVHIVAVTPQDELLLVEQHRIPVGTTVFELPAGVIGDEAGREGETPEQAGARELIEETGYQAARIERLYVGPSSPGMADELITCVRAHDLEKVGEGGGVDGENITVHRVPLAEVADWLAARVAEGRLVDHRVYAGLFFLRDALKS